MNILKNLFLFNKKTDNNNFLNKGVVDHYGEIAKLVKESRIQQNLTVQELSRITKIPEKTINSIENNNKDNRPEYPFIRSILIKLEECLLLKRNSLLKLAIRGRETFQKERNDVLINKLDILNTWHGSILYFFILVLSIFVLKRYFILNVNVIEIQNIEKKILKNNRQ